MRRYLLPALLITILLLQPASSSASAGDNLLTNPGFEAPYTQFATPDGGGFVANAWMAWWFNDSGDAFAAPEYDIAPIERDPNRVHSGAAGQALFRPNVLFQAGVYQRVEAPAGALLELTLYGHAWSGFCQPGDPPLCDASDSHYGLGANRVFMMVGIDPTGGTDPFSSTVQWSPQRVVWDHYEPFTVHARAQASTVTVFTWSANEYPAPVNNVYWDDASLAVVEQGSTPPPGGPSFQPNGTINLRSGPGTSNAILGQVGPGAWYPITGQQNGWYAFYFDGQTGWVLGSLVQVAGLIAPPPAVPQAVQSNVAANVRSGPDTASSILGALTPGAVYPALGQQGAWVTIRFGDLIGYVYAPLVQAASADPLPGNAVIDFAATTNRVSAGQCAAVSWSVEGVQAIYFQQAGVTGHEGRTVCPTATTTYTLDVLLVDGTQTQRVVTILVR